MNKKRFPKALNHLSIFSACSWCMLWHVIACFAFIFMNERFIKVHADRIMSKLVGLLSNWKCIYGYVLCNRGHRDDDDN